jgi:hypothetical protein
MELKGSYNTRVATDRKTGIVAINLHLKLLIYSAVPDIPISQYSKLAAYTSCPEPMPMVAFCNCRMRQHFTSTLHAHGMDVDC